MKQWVDLFGLQLAIEHAIGGSEWSERLMGTDWLLDGMADVCAESGG